MGRYDILVKNCSFLGNQDVYVNTAIDSFLHEEKGTIHLWTVMNVFHIRVRILTSPNPYIMLINFPIQTRYAFITEVYKFQESIIFYLV